MLLSDLVETSAAVAATRSRLAKTELLQALLRRTPDDELGVVIGLLTASPRQGRTGVGWSTLAGVTDALEAVAEGTSPATGEPLGVVDVDTAFDGLAAASTATDRRAVLSTLLARASADERWFLSGVLLGEVRQGALDAALAEAVAVASEVPSAAVRRAWMLTGSLAQAALLARTEGEAGLSAVGLRVLRAVRPMLAASAKSVAEALSDKAFAGANRVYVDESSTARGSRCTATATRYGSSPARSRRSRTGCPRWWRPSSRCPPSSWCSTASRWSWPTTAGRAPSPTR